MLQQGQGRQWSGRAWPVPMEGGQCLWRMVSVYGGGQCIWRVVNVKKG